MPKTSAFEPKSYFLFQVDLSGHSKYMEKNPRKKKAATARAELALRLKTILSDHYFTMLFWAGDGGLFVGDKKTKVASELNKAVVATRNAFQGWKAETSDRSELRLRITLHADEIYTHKEHGLWYSDGLSVFLKKERFIAIDNEAVMTDSVLSVMDSPFDEKWHPHYNERIKKEHEWDLYIYSEEEPQEEGLIEAAAESASILNENMENDESEKQANGRDDGFDTAGVVHQKDTRNSNSDVSDASMNIAKEIEERPGTSMVLPLEARKINSTICDTSTVQALANCYKKGEQANCDLLVKSLTAMAELIRIANVIYTGQETISKFNNIYRMRARLETLFKDGKDLNFNTGVGRTVSKMRTRIEELIRHLLTMKRGAWDWKQIAINYISIRMDVTVQDLDVAIQTSDAGTQNQNEEKYHEDPTAREFIDHLASIYETVTTKGEDNLIQALQDPEFRHVLTEYQDLHHEIIDAIYTITRDHLHRTAKYIKRHFTGYTSENSLVYLDNFIRSLPHNKDVERVLPYIWRTDDVTVK